MNPEWCEQHPLFVKHLMPLYGKPQCRNVRVKLGLPSILHKCYMYLKDNCNTVYKTMCARFTAYRRMKRNRDASKVAEALSSASIIAISLIALKSKDIDLSNNISTFTIILSTFLLVLSQLLSNLDYEKRMKNYHACGNELNHLYRVMYFDSQSLSEEEQKTKVIGYINQYQGLLIKYNLNHTSFDYDYAMSVLPDAKVCFLSSLWLKCRYYVLDIYMLYWLIALIPIVCIGWYYLQMLIA